MSRKPFCLGLAASGLVLAIAFGGPAAASPLAGASSAAKVAPEAAVIEVKTKKKKVRRSVRRAPPPYAQDTVSSIYHDGVGYGYNRFTGQRYMSCMIDLGYGRVEPCDNGNAGGPGFN